MAFTGPTEDRLAIRELYASTADASSRGDVEDWLACWTDDGQWKTHLFERTGKDELREQWDILWAGFSKVAYLGDVGSIEVEGDAATCRCTAREIIRLKDGGLFKLAGLYHDRLARKDGKWLFQRREYEALVEEFPG